MANKSYKITLLAMVAGILFTFAAVAQDKDKSAAKASEKAAAKASATAKSSSAADAKAVQELRAKQQELRTQQQEINRQMQELSRKISDEVRKQTYSRFTPDSMHYKAYPNYKMDSAWTKALVSSKFKMDTAWLKSLRGANAFQMDSNFIHRLQLTGRLASADFGKNMDELGRKMGKLGVELGKSFEGLDFSMNGTEKSLRDPNYKAVEKSKTVSKSYPVSADDKLSILNQFGKVTVNTWNKKEIKVDIEIKAYDGSDTKAQDLLDAVTIDDSKVNNVVIFKTKIARENNGWWSRTVNGVQQNHGVQVNYVVYMPAKSSLDVSNTYGAVILPDMDGVIKAKVSYGSLKAGKLSNPANEIKTTYSQTSVESIQSGMISQQYGQINIGTANNLTLDLNYAPNSSIGHVINGGDFKLNYSGDFKIEQLDDRFKSVNVRSNYSPQLSINAGGTNFDFDVSVSNASFSYNNKVNIQSKEPDDKSRSWSPTQNYKGQYGKGSDAKVVIKSTYGSVQFL